jgi:DNA-binding MarR family transcriptional regulator
VVRKQSEIDGRAKNAYITEEGLAVTNAMYDAMIAAQHRLLAPLSEVDRRKFLELLHILVDANNEYGRASMKAL